LAVLERKAPWHPRFGYREPSNMVLPGYALNLDKEGLLWLGVALRGPQWKKADAEELPSGAAKSVDGSRPTPTTPGGRVTVRFEVIDPVSGTVLAATRVDPEIEQALLVELLRNVFPGTTRTYAASVDSLGRKALVIYDLHLVEVDRNRE
jgi:hypothetical protein